MAPNLISVVVRVREAGVLNKLAAACKKMWPQLTMDGAHFYMKVPVSWLEMCALRGYRMHVEVR